MTENEMQVLHQTIEERAWVAVAEAISVWQDGKVASLESVQIPSKYSGF